MRNLSSFGAGLLFGIGLWLSGMANPRKVLDFLDITGNWDPSLLLVDEPIAGMTHQETERTAELLRSLSGKHTVVVVEHDMDFIRSIARTVTVLHQGKLLCEGSMDEVQNDPKVVEVYLGE